MQLEFIRLRVENFGSFTTRQQLTFDQSHPGVYFIRGENLVEPKLGANGAGKSTLFTALSWCLFGKTPNGLHGTDLKPWASKGTTQVSVMLKCDNTQHRIVRTARPNLLTLDKQEVDQAAIDKLLGLSFGVFEQTILLGQGRPLFHDLANREKLQLLTDVLDLDRWDRYSQRASERHDTLTQQMQGSAADAQATATLIAQLEAQHAKIGEQATEWEQARAGKLKEREAEHAKLAKHLDKVGKLFAEIDVKHDSVGLELKHINQDLATFERQYQAAQMDMHKADTQVEMLQSRLADAKVQLAELQKNKTCPTCGQPIKQKDIAAHRLKLDGKIAGLQSTIKKAASVNLRDVVTKATKKVEAHRRHQQDYTTNLEQLTAERNLLSRQLIEATSATKQAKKDCEHWEQEVNPYRSQVRDLQKGLAVARGQKKEHEHRFVILEQRCERTKFWVKGFKDVKLHTLNEVLQELELVTNAMLDEVGLDGWAIKFAIERETKSGTVQRGLITTVESPRNKDPVKWASWSGGEAQRLRLVGALALSQVLLGRAGIDTNLEILDEPSRSLSSEGVGDLCDFLANRAETLGKLIYYIDHSAVESSSFQQVITVTKTKQGSTLSCS